MLRHRGQQDVRSGRDRCPIDPGDSGNSGSTSTCASRADGILAFVEAAPAWEEERTVASWRRERRVACLWLVLGVVLLSMFVVSVTRQADHTRWLMKHGVRTPGVVLEDSPEAQRCGQVSVPVQFKEDAHTFFVDGCGGRLSKGDVVVVRYNPADPDDYTVDGHANEHPRRTLAEIVCLVVGTMLLLGASARFLRVHRLRRVLQGSEWKPLVADPVRYPSPWTKGRWAIRVADGSPELVTQPKGLREALSEGGAVQFAGDPGGPVVVRDTKADRILLARQPRSKRQRARAAAASTRLPAAGSR
jgi:hypothetical protein